ncbi:MAG: hypothetical protein JW829_01835, partial [Pirellulales bacterium]|nr:hypothetical protein [Pirellulales bacterium]
LEAFERVLGAREGSLRRVDRDVVDKLAADLSEIQDTTSGSLAQHRATATDSRRVQKGGDDHGPPSSDHT